jgi:MoaA/NifB/PqqE/SkfB family radical SAM enzyme
MTLSTNQPFNPNRDPRKNIEINIGKSCNNRCVFCLDGLPKKEDRSYIDFDFMQAELQRWYTEGHRSVGFLGGEPTTYPKIVESVQFAKNLGYTRIAIATNATKLRLAHFTDKLLDAGLTRVTISMHGHTASLEDKLTRVPGNFLKKCQAILYLQEKRKQGFLPDGLSINIVLNGWNYKYLPKMLQFFYEKMGIVDIRVNYIRPEGYAEGNKDLTPRFTEVVPYLVKAILLNEYHFKKTFTFGGIPMCMLPPQIRNSEEILRKYMGEYRDLSTNCSIRGESMTEVEAMYGEQLHDTNDHHAQRYQAQQVQDGVSVVENGRARFNWQDRKRFDLKAHPPVCNTCTQYHVCEGVWDGYLQIWDSTELHPIQ